MKKQTKNKTKNAYSKRFSKINLTSAEYERFIRMSHSVATPVRMPLEKRLKYAVKAIFKMD